MNNLDQNVGKQFKNSVRVAFVVNLMEWFVSWETINEMIAHEINKSEDTLLSNFETNQENYYFPLTIFEFFKSTITFKQFQKITY